jgi:hypothetical protein
VLGREDTLQNMLDDTNNDEDDNIVEDEDLQYSDIVEFNGDKR